VKSAGVAPPAGAAAGEADHGAGVAAGSWTRCGTLGDRWTVVTQDGSLSAHFEHTVAITENGARILTTVA